MNCSVFEGWCRLGVSWRSRLPSLLALLSVLLAGLLLEHRSMAQDAKKPVEPRVLVVPIQDEITLATVALVRKTLRHARDAGIAAVVLRIDTPGGRIDALHELQSIVRTFEEEGIKPTAFVERRAQSAGALLAFACDRIYMRTGATMGASTPVIVSPIGAHDIPDKDLRAKAISAERANVRALLERRVATVTGLSLVAEAMIDPDLRVYQVRWRKTGGFLDEVVEFVDAAGLAAIHADKDREVVGKEEQLPGSPVSLTADEARRFRVSQGTYPSIEEMVREELHFDPAQIQVWQVGLSEHGVAWLNSVKPVLFVIGFILLLIELKTPGFFVPGILGLVLLGVAFYASHAVGLATLAEILLFFIGLGLLAVEIFVLPGTLITGVIGFACIVLGLLWSQQTFLFPESETDEALFTRNIWHLILMFGGIFLGTVTFYRFIDRIPFLKRAVQPPTDTGSWTGAATERARPNQDSPLLGLTGTAVTDLRPAGILAVGDDRHDVVTLGAFVPKGTPLRIAQVEGNRIVVEPIEVQGIESQRGIGMMGTMIFLLILSFGLFVAEVFFVSFGVFGLLGSLSVIASVFIGFTEFGNATGFVVLGAAAAGVPLCIWGAFRLLPKTPMGDAYFLPAPDPKDVTAASEEPGLAELLHKDGVSISPLRPSGFVRIGGRRVDVVTRGESIEPNTEVRVIRVDSNRVVVAALAQRAPESQTSDPGASDPGASGTGISTT